MYVIDIEADGFLDEVSKIHVLSYDDQEGNKGSITDYDEMKLFLDKVDTIIGHNIVVYDIPALEKILGIKIKARLIDTLALSWYLFPDLNRHGLEAWGEIFGVPKPKVVDWKNEPVEVYIHRCEEDVRINLRLWKKIKHKLSIIYETDNPSKLKIIDYLSFKMDCMREQERSKWKLDKDLCNKSLAELYPAKEEKENELTQVMPWVEKLAPRKFPAKPFKKDGTLSVEGAKWQKLLREQGLTKDHKDTIYVVASREPPNPSSNPQIKEWLFSLGWVPETFKEVREDDGSVREIPQVKAMNSKELCPSVLKLAEIQPSVRVLEGLSIINHRIGVFEGFLKNVDEDGFVKAEIQGITNTLRFKHKEPCVNLPGVDKPWGKQIRGSLIAREGYEQCGVDIVQLEVTTKRHYMYPYDPDYADELGKEGFDEHLSMAVFCGKLTEEQAQAHKDGTEDHSSVRKEYKQVNFSGIYGIGAPKLSRAIKKPVKEAKKLLDDYWAKNWSVKQIAKDQYVKQIKGEMWLLNPVNGFYYSLRYEKDIFSTLNQGTGAYVFDCFLREVRKLRPQVTAQFHDEAIFEIKLGNRDKMDEVLKKAIKAVNDKLKLNAEVKIDFKYGQTYSEIH